MRCLCCIESKKCGGNAHLFLVISVFAFLFNRLYTHYAPMEDSGQLWAWAKVLYNGNYVNITNICLALTYLSIGTYYSMTKYKQKTIVNVVLIMLGVIMMHFETHKDVAKGGSCHCFWIISINKKMANKLLFSVI